MEKLNWLSISSWTLSFQDSSCLARLDPWPASLCKGAWMYFFSTLRKQIIPFFFPGSCDVTSLFLLLSRAYLPCLWCPFLKSRKRTWSPWWKHLAQSGQMTCDLWFSASLCGRDHYAKPWTQTEGKIYFWKSVMLGKNLQV